MVRIVGAKYSQPVAIFTNQPQPNGYIVANSNHRMNVQTCAHIGAHIIFWQTPISALKF